jgi:hypothetical protein
MFNKEGRKSLVSCPVPYYRHPILLLRGRNIRQFPCTTGITLFLAMRFLLVRKPPPPLPTELMDG